MKIAASIANLNLSGISSMSHRKRKTLPNSKELKVEQSIFSEVKDIINKVRDQKDKTLVSKLSKVFDEKGIKEKNPDKYKDAESLQKVKDMILAWAKENNIEVD